MSTALWKLEKDLCRCCHAEGSFKHLSDPCFLLGQEEIYSIMLQDCLDLKIVPMTGALSDATYTICETCVARLRDASNFKKQVQDCEERFKDMYSKNMIRGFEVKDEPFESDTEMKPEFLIEEDEDDDDAFMKFDDDGDGDSSFEDREEMITVEIEAVPKAKGKGKAKPKPKPKKAPVKKGKTKEKPIKLESEDLTEAAVSGEKKKGRKRGEALIIKEYAQFCKVQINQEGKKTYSCILCTKQYDERRRFTSHYKTVHLQMRYKIKKTRPCVICKEEILPRLRWRHMEERHGWQAPTCPDCNRKFSYPFQVAAHQKEVHKRLENLNHVCEQCGDKFSSYPRLKAHEVKHLEVKNYKCHKCPKAFKTITYLKHHLVRHSDVKEHICQQCGAAFVNYKYLKAHTYKHMTEKNVKCEFCSKGFKTRRDLNIHKKIHTGDKKHKCPVCQKAYVQSSNMKYHIRRHHPETIETVKTEEEPQTP